MNPLLDRLGVRLPIIQAPMAGTSTPAMAAAATNAGALGSIGVAAMDPAAVCKAIVEIRAATDGPFNVNVFCHRPATPDPARERAWLEALRPVFHRFGTEPPEAIGEIYRSFLTDTAMQELLLEARPPVVSFHFGLPPDDVIARLKAAGIVLLSTATNLAEARAAAAAGIDAIVAQGIEAGGHRGMFDPAAPDAELGTLALTRLLVSRIDLPIIAAGGIMDGAGIASALALGAAAAQLGTAFIDCAESSADEAYRSALRSEAAFATAFTEVISGRPARCLPNGFTTLAQAELAGLTRPDYPIVYDAGKALIAAAKAAGDGSFGAQWAGQGAPLARSLTTAKLIAELENELRIAR